MEIKVSPFSIKNQSRPNSISRYHYSLFSFPSNTYQNTCQQQPSAFSRFPLASQSTIIWLSPSPALKTDPPEDQQQPEPAKCRSGLLRAYGSSNWGRALTFSRFPQALSCFMTSICRSQALFLSLPLHFCLPKGWQFLGFQLKRHSPKAARSASVALVSHPAIIFLLTHSFKLLWLLELK